MKRTRPTKRIGHIAKVSMRPERAADLSNYYDFKKEKELPTFDKEAKGDTIEDTPEMLRWHSQRELEYLQEAQQIMFEEKGQTDEIDRVRVAIIEDTYRKLHRRFIDVNNFMKECEEKKYHAQRKIDEELSKQDTLLSKIDEYTEKLNTLMGFYLKFQDTVKAFEPYEKVLDDVVEKSTEFSTVRDCMDRCDALMMAQVEINKYKLEKLDDMEIMRANMAKATHQAALDVIGWKNDLIETERGYQKACHIRQYWERVAIDAKNVLATNMMNKERCQDGLHIVYSMLCRRRGIETIRKRYEIEHLLDFIQDEAQIIKECIDIYNRRHKKKTLSKTDLKDFC